MSEEIKLISCNTCKKEIPEGKYMIWVQAGHAEYDAEYPPEDEDDSTFAGTDGSGDDEYYCSWGCLKKNIN